MANTDPNHWFLAPGDIPRLPHFTEGNLVEPLIDGENYMTHLAGLMRSQGFGDYFHISGWRVTPEMTLTPRTAGSPSFLDEVIALAGRGVDVRAMVWFAALGGSGGSGSGGGVLPKHNIDNGKFIGGVESALGTGTAILDNRTAGLTSSHHQKTIVLRSQGHDWAYVGGIDVCNDRWDTQDHDNPAPRHASQEAFEGWHDVHAVMRGPAVAQVWQNFTDRWNDRTPPHGFPTPPIPGGKVPPMITASPPAPATFGPHAAQVLRTLPCGVFPFSSGEQTARLAYEKAIELAEHYVYIEDQYFWPCSRDPGSSMPGTPPTGDGVISRLRDATARGVKVILCLSHQYDAASLAPYHNAMRQESLDLIGLGDISNLFVYHLQATTPTDADIYVHAKVMIIDDCYAVIGTPNIGRRSQTNDTELAVAVVDRTTVDGTMNEVPVSVCNYARDLRLRLWAEHLGLSSFSTIMDPITGLAAWPQFGGAPRVHHACIHNVPPDRPNPLFPDFRPIMNLERIC